MPSIRAPRGGLVIGGRYYRAGRFIPASELSARAQTDKKLGRKIPQHDLSAITKNLLKHKRELDPKHLDFLRKVHDGLSQRYGNQTPHAIAQHADTLHKTHGKSGPEHHGVLSHHLGSAHALLDMAGGAGGNGRAATPASTGAPGETAIKGADAIKVVKTEHGFTATFGDASADGATAEEAVGKLVVENPEALGLKVEGVGDGGNRSQGTAETERQYSQS